MTTRAPSLLLLAALAGCATAVEVPAPPGPTPLVEIILVAGEAPAARLRWSDGLGTPGPIAAADVALGVGPVGGAAEPFTPVSTEPALFRARVPVEPGRRYRLTGTIAGVAIQAETLVPGPLEVFAPAGVIDGRPGQSVDFRWRAAGAVVFSVAEAFFPATQQHHTRDTVGVLLLDPGTPLPSDLVIHALNETAARYLFNLAAAEGNITGALGVFGAASVATRPVRWQ